MIKKPMKPENALARVADLCARSEQCRHEVREKLMRWGIGTADTEKIIARLEQERYIDDSRYARAYVADKFRFAGWGKRKIALMLRSKRIASDSINDALDQIDDDEYFDAALRTLRSRCRGQLPETREDAARILRFGAQRGFETDILFKALRTLRQTLEADDEDC